MAVVKVSAQEAFKANVDAVSQDYICEPRIGKDRSRSSVTAFLRP